MALMVKAEHAGLVVAVESGDDSAPEDNSVAGSNVLAMGELAEAMRVTCLWCKEDIFEVESTIKTCPDHSYHRECLKTWLL